MKVIVFGGSGFLGSHVADALTKARHEVIVFDKVKSPYLVKGQKMIIGDILDEHAVNKAMAGCEIVYNFAGIAGMDEAKKHPVDTAKNNIVGNAILLECSRVNRIKRYVFASSIYVYSRHGSFYRASKQACELFVESYNEAYGLEYTILRYGSLYGPRANNHNWLKEILREALKDKKITRFGDGEEVREYIHAEDAARCSVEILGEEYRNERVIIAGHQQMKIKDLLMMIKEIMNNEVAIVYKDPGSRGCPHDPSLHYEITPYSFKPGIAKKFISRHYMALGEGVLSILDNLHNEKEKHTLPS